MDFTTTHLTLNQTYLDTYIHLHCIQVDIHMRYYLWCWCIWLQNYNLHCLHHTRRHLRHHRSRSNKNSSTEVRPHQSVAKEFRTLCCHTWL